MRLQKYIALCGVCSRRKAEEIILSGRVSVNGKKSASTGIIIDPENDTVCLDGKEIKIVSEKIYIMLNKPKGYICSVKDEHGRKSVLDLLNTAQRVYPVGRLDYDTEGLLLLTNDGDFSYAMTHPKHEIKKNYIARVSGVPAREALKSFRSGLVIDDVKTAPAQIKIVEKSGGGSVLSITIHEGRNRQVRKMCEKIGVNVTALKRVSYGGLDLGTLKTGEYRFLSREERELLLSLAKSAVR